MKILVIADKESKNYWDYYTPGKLDGIDLIISCGDLEPHYLQFLVTFAHCPVLYVHGNHDDKYDQIPADGCICIEDRIWVFQGVRILGLGGSLRYKVGKNQYEQSEMNKRVKKLWFQFRKHKGIDILVTHAPAKAWVMVMIDATQALRLLLIFLKSISQDIFFMDMFIPITEENSSDLMPMMRHLLLMDMKLISLNMSQSMLRNLKNINKSYFRERVMNITKNMDLGGRRYVF